jgi:hypothetical protein
LTIHGGDLLVGTRRHLHRIPLSSPTLTPAVQVQLPWEVAQPHHMAVGDALQGRPGLELVFASIHGGLVFADPGSLQLLHEWPEPGISDFRLDGSMVTILSTRGLLAKVDFTGPTHAATLHAVSQTIPNGLRLGGAVETQPCQGVPADLELMVLDWSAAGQGQQLAAVSIWNGDTDGSVVRGHMLSNLAQAPTALASSPGSLTPYGLACVDIATCRQEASGGPLTAWGDHCLVLTDKAVVLVDQYAQIRAHKLLDQTAASSSYPFFRGAHTMCVGELVANSASYSEEVVFATDSGLVWMHIADIAAPGALLPATGAAGTWTSGYAMDTEKAGGSQPGEQYRTNRTLATAWALARRPLGSGLDADLHVLDQRGVYWKVGHSGSCRMYSHDPLYFGRAKGWQHVGSVSSRSYFGSKLQLLNPGLDAGIRTSPWMPKVPDPVVFELQPGNAPYRANNWQAGFSGFTLLDGFAPFFGGGSTLVSGGTTEIWSWTGFTSWGNLLEGVRVNSGSLASFWSSTGDKAPSPAGDADRVPFLSLRSWPRSTPLTSLQAAIPVRLASSATAVVTGCPGGRVRVHVVGGSPAANTSGAWRVDDSVSGAVLGQPTESDDFGLGGCALAVRYQSTPQEKITIWYGTVSSAPPRPSNYTSVGGIHPTLPSDAFATGAVVRMEWVPGAGFQNVGAPVEFRPSASDPRGAHGVVGLHWMDTVAYPTQGGELVVATMSGDVFVLDADSMQIRMRTHVDGALGFHSSLLSADLDSDGVAELYVGGSKGLWRFTQPGE